MTALIPSLLKMETPATQAHGMNEIEISEENL